MPLVTIKIRNHSFQKKPFKKWYPCVLKFRWINIFFTLIKPNISVFYSVTIYFERKAVILLEYKHEGNYWREKMSIFEYWMFLFSFAAFLPLKNFLCRSSQVSICILHGIFNICDILSHLSWETNLIRISNISAFFCYMQHEIL